MLKRILALAVCLALCLMPALAEESTPQRDNRPLFLSRLAGALESCDPASQALSPALTVPPDSVTLRLLPTENGLRLEADAGGTTAAALEAGQEALWILYGGQSWRFPSACSPPWRRVMPLPPPGGWTRSLPNTGSRFHYGP